MAKSGRMNSATESTSGGADMVKGRRWFAVAGLLIASVAAAGDFRADPVVKKPERKFLAEWKQKTGYARVDINNVQMRSDFRMSMKHDVSDRIARGTSVSVKAVDVDEVTGSLDIDVMESGSRRWTEIKLFLDELIGEELTATQREQLAAMWDRLISPERVPAAAAELDQPSLSPANAALVHVYRPRRAAGSMVSHPVKCDFMDVAELENAKRFSMLLPPGTHHFYLLTIADKKLTLNFGAGREYFLRDDLEFTGALLVSVVAEQGAKQMRKLKYAQAEDIWDRWVLPPPGETTSP